MPEPTVLLARGLAAGVTMVVRRRGARLARLVGPVLLVLAAVWAGLAEFGAQLGLTTPLPEEDAARLALVPALAAAGTAAGVTALLARPDPARTAVAALPLPWAAVRAGAVWCVVVLATGTAALAVAPLARLWPGGPGDAVATLLLVAPAAAAGAAACAAAAQWALHGLRERSVADAALLRAPVVIAGWSAALGVGLGVARWVGERAVAGLSSGTATVLVVLACLAAGTGVIVAAFALAETTSGVAAGGRGRRVPSVSFPPSPVARGVLVVAVRFVRRTQISALPLVHAAGAVAVLVLARGREDDLAVQVLAMLAPVAGYTVALLRGLSRTRPALEVLLGVSPTAWWASHVACAGLPPSLAGGAAALLTGADAVTLLAALVLPWAAAGVGAGIGLALRPTPSAVGGGLAALALVAAVLALAGTLALRLVPSLDPSVAALNGQVLVGLLILAVAVRQEGRTS